MMDLFRNPSSLKANKFETAMWATRLVLMCMGFVSTLILFRVSIIPYTFDLIVSTFPRLWISARGWLSPAFVYFIVNFIIIIIAASSNFHHKNKPVSDSAPTDSRHTTTAITEQAVLDTTVLHHHPEPENERNEPKEEEKEIEELEEVKDSGLSFKKPLTDPSPEKCTNDYISPDSDDKNDDTLDATWKAIMEGQGKTETPQLKKSDTWSATNRITRAKPLRGNDDGGDDHVAWAKKELKKSDTFNDTASLRREKSMSPEELYRRAEAFIQKIKNQMKLQRLESYQRVMELVNRGVKYD